MIKHYAVMDVISGFMSHVISILQNLFMMNWYNSHPWILGFVIPILFLLLRLIVPSIKTNHIQHHSSYLHCICLDVRSLFPKRFALLAFLSVVNADVVAITETFLDDTIISSQLLTSDYTIFHRDRNRHGRGVMILVRSTIAAVRMLDLETNCEILWLKLLTAPSSFLFGVFYRPPGSPVDILGNLNCSLASIQGSSTPLVLCGDFNVPSIDWSLTSPIVSSANSKLLCSIVQDHQGKSYS